MWHLCSTAVFLGGMALIVGAIGCDRPQSRPLHQTSDSTSPAPSAPTSASAETSTQSAASVSALGGQCRRTGRTERVYQEADLGAPPLGDLNAAIPLILSGEVNQPSFGWIRISFPYSGYVQTPFLKLCDTDEVALLECGVVTQPQLAIKPTPTTESEPSGTLLFEQGFRITGQPVVQQQPATQAGRVWLPIERFGVSGWVTESIPDGFAPNLRRLPCREIGLPAALG